MTDRWNRLRSALALSGALMMLAAPAASQAPESTLGVEGLLRGRVEALRAHGAAYAGGVELRARSALPAFYEARAFSSAWSGEEGRVALDELLATIDGADRHGLEPGDYHRSVLASLRRAAAGNDPESTADLDLVATDAFLLLGSHLLHGRVNPETIEPEWLANRRSARMDSVLTEAVASRRVASTLQGLAPVQPRYARMTEARERLLAAAAAGGWPRVPDGGTLEPGDTAAAVPVLRARLIASQDYSGRRSESTVFDEELAAAVRAFQERHGLEADGVVGPATRRALAVSPEERARRIEINLERWRWLPADLGARHIEVNIAGFQAQVVENGHVARTHRAVVGRQYRQTPMFSSSMTYLVLAPYWHVPPTIARVDKLPLVRQDLGYLAAQNMSVLEQASNRPVSASEVPWATISGTEFNRRYRFRQDPGPWNALGSVKFMFPNRHNVYLHDTPTRELFARAARSFSSGCIRVENPLELADYLLADQVAWTPEAIRSAAGRSAETTVRLTAPVPVHLLYWTAWAEPDGTLHFRDDIYGRDDVVAGALAARVPGA